MDSPRTLTHARVAAPSPDASRGERPKSIQRRCWRTQRNMVHPCVTAPVLALAGGQAGVAASPYNARRFRRQAPYSTQLRCPPLARGGALVRHHVIAAPALARAGSQAGPRKRAPYYEQRHCGSLPREVSQGALGGVWLTAPALALAGGQSSVDDQADELAGGGGVE